MKNKYLDFISDQHLLRCIQNLHDAYLRAKQDITKEKFYKNKIDIFKLTFDAHFNGLSQDELIEGEILRQIDKSINNSIGTFHEQILGGIDGYEMGNQSGYDIKAKDNTLFAEIKNKHNTTNSNSEFALFDTLKRFADTHKKAKCYWVQLLAKSSFLENWTGEIKGEEKSHSRVFKISGDRFYSLLTGDENAFYKLYKVLPLAVPDYLNSIDTNALISANSALADISNESKESKRTILDQISFENYFYYPGFSDL
jgi:hypothetical protein